MNLRPGEEVFRLVSGGVTRVDHNMPGEHNINKCPEPGCAVYNVIYDLPDKQVTSLLCHILE